MIRRKRYWNYNQLRFSKALFLQAVNTLKNGLEEWKKKYILIAPDAGNISVAGFLQVNQPVKAGQIICYITPVNSPWCAEMFVPQANFGKVKQGQKVLLKFAAYPDAEFGSVEGSISFVSAISSDSGYLTRIVLPNGRTTNYNKQVKFHED